MSFGFTSGPSGGSSSLVNTNPGPEYGAFIAWLTGQMNEPVSGQPGGQPSPYAPVFGQPSTTPPRPIGGQGQDSSFLQYLRDRLNGGANQTLEGIFSGRPQSPMPSNPFGGGQNQMTLFQMLQQMQGQGQRQHQPQPFIPDTNSTLNAYINDLRNGGRQPQAGRPGLNAR